MPIPRAEIVDSRNPSLYHCVSRCVRQAFLCGAGGRSRRRWLMKRVRLLASLFGIDVVTYSFLENHFHLLLWTDPERAKTWSPEEVARRWLTLCPKSAPRRCGLEDAINTLSRDDDWVAERRVRLASISWFNRLLKQPMALMANREDGTTGHFWEGRFRSYRIVDVAGALTVCCYIDMNEIRAGLARTPETSSHSSVSERIAARQLFAAALKHPDGVEAGEALPAHPEDGLWLTPFGKEAKAAGRRTLFDCGVDAYLEILDTIARVARGVGQAVPAALAPILERLELDLDTWVKRLHRGLRELRGTTVGAAAARAAEAARRGRGRVVDPLTARPTAR